MSRMKTWNVIYERHNPQLGVYICTRKFEAATAESAVKKANREFREAEKRGAYGWNVAISAFLA